MYYVGLDLGQKRDFSAIVAVDRQGTGLVVRYAERMPLGTPYPRVVERVREIVRSSQLLGNCTLSVDATGVGAPVVDMLSAARLGCELNAITITGGDGAPLFSYSESHNLLCSSRANIEISFFNLLKY